MRKNYFKLMAFILFCMGFTLKSQAQDEARLMRYPDINKNLIAFVYDGDIWTVDSNGGEAKRLTSHPEQLAKGEDPCIEKAVEVLMKELEQNPPKKVKAPASPDRSGWNEGMK